MRTGWIAVLLVVSGCVSPLANLRTSRPITVGSTTFELRSVAPGEQPDRVAASLARAVPMLDRWGGLALPVTVSLLPSHDDLETAVRRSGFGWLRAWARYDDVLLQSPDSWLGPSGREGELDELLAHELTHCLLFQRAATKETWLTREIPLWFREGMATNTARQVSRFPNLEDLARWLEADPSHDVFNDGEALSQDFYEPVYGLAHHSVAFLLRRYGDQAVLATIAAMAQGSRFPEAFAAGTGLSLASFQRDFVNYVRWRGFRSAGRSVKKREWRELIDELRPRR